MSRHKQQKHASDARTTSSDIPPSAETAAQAAAARKRHEKRHPQQQRHRAPLLGARALAFAALSALVALYINMIAPGALPALQRAIARHSTRMGLGRGGSMLSEPARVEGDRVLGPSFGLYPKGCRWREVTDTNGSSEVRDQCLYLIVWLSVRSGSPCCFRGTTAAYRLLPLTSASICMRILSPHQIKALLALSSSTRSNPPQTPSIPLKKSPGRLPLLELPHPQLDPHPPPRLLPPSRPRPRARWLVVSERDP